MVPFTPNSIICLFAHKRVGEIDTLPSAISGLVSNTQLSENNMLYWNIDWNFMYSFLVTSNNSNLRQVFGWTKKDIHTYSYLQYGRWYRKKLDLTLNKTFSLFLNTVKRQRGCRQLLPSLLSSRLAEESQFFQDESRSGDFFTNNLCAAFTSPDPKSIRRQSTQAAFCAFGIGRRKSCA